MPDKTLPRLETERLVLRLGEPEDVPAILQYNIEVLDFHAPSSPAHSHDYYTAEFWTGRLERHQAEFQDDVSLCLLLLHKADQKLLGTASFTQIARGPSQSCFLGYGLDQAYEGKGYMREALEAAIRYVFGTLNLHRIQACYLPHNVRSGKLLKRLGFSVEGYAPQLLQIDGQWRDHLVTSLINDAWVE